MNQTQGWHMAEWGIWGWAETVLKLVAVGAGLVAFVRYLSAGALVVANHPHLAAVIVLVLASLGAVLQLWTRWQQRETISFIFAVLNLLGHLGLLVALLRVPQLRTLPIIFGVFYVLGQLVKLQFLRATGYTEGGANSSGMQRIAVVQAVLYALFVILLLL